MDLPFSVPNSLSRQFDIKVILHATIMKLRTEHQHGGDYDVGEQAEDAEGEVRALSEPRPDDLKKRLGSRSAYLELDGEHRKEQDLNRSSRRVPVCSADAVLGTWYKVPDLYRNVLTSDTVLVTWYKVQGMYRNVQISDTIPAAWYKGHGKSMNVLISDTVPVTW